MTPPPPAYTLFPYTTLFRSVRDCALGHNRHEMRAVFRRAVDVGVHAVGIDLDGSDGVGREVPGDRKSTRLNSSHVEISYAVFCLKKKNYEDIRRLGPRGSGE